MQNLPVFITVPEISFQIGGGGEARRSYSIPFLLFILCVLRVLCVCVWSELTTVKTQLQVGLAMLVRGS